MDQHDLAHFVRALRHRGPDGEGTWLSDDGLIGLSHTRLAIIDLSERAAQPMCDAEGSVISFNGEIYNHRQLRDELTQQGCVFRTQSDTEVVLTAYRVWGPQSLQRLRGMFAFAIAIPQERRVFLARDPFGIKPLYIASNAQVIRFASEITALQPFVESSVSLDALIDLFTWGNIAAPLTISTSINALEPGSYAYVDSQGVHITRWSQGATVLDDGDGLGTRAEAIEAVRESSKYHLESDVEVGVFLSSGVDSTVLASLCAHYSPRQLRTLTVRNPALDESVEAASFAKSIGANHTTVEFDSAEITTLLDEAVRSLDQPSLDGINSFFVARAAQQAGLKVAISGVGGDELFGGYDSFTRLPRLQNARRVASLVPRTPRNEGEQHSPATWDRSTMKGRANWLRSYLRYDWGPYLLCRGVMAPHETARLLDLPVSAVIDRIQSRLSCRLLGRGPNWVSQLEMQQYLQPQLLRDIDAASMRSSVEVRTPLVDSVLFERIARLPERQRASGKEKQLLQDAALHQLSQFPANKRGFNVPIEAWMRSQGGQLLESVPPLLNPDVATQLTQQSLSGLRTWTHGWMIHVLGTHLTKVTF